MKGKVQTVLGDIDPGDLGITMMHEHLLIDFLRWRREAGNLPARDYPDPRSLEPMTLANRHWIAQYGRHPEEYLLDDEQTATSEAARYQSAGGGTLVDVTNPDLAREPAALERISEATGLHVVMGCGTYVSSMHRPDMGDLTVDDLAHEMIGDIQEGADGTDIKAGIIGEIGTEYPIADDEGKSLVAAAIAQQETGAAVSIHPGRDTRAPLAVMGILAEAGADATRVIMGHLDRTLFELSDFDALADTGCYLEFDLFGQESSYYAHAPIDMPNDALRINIIMHLVDAGLGDRILVSQDICQKTNTVTYGGHGYGHILENVVPVMLRKGMTQDTLDAILMQNPATILPLVR